MLVSRHTLPNCKRGQRRTQHDVCRRTFQVASMEPTTAASKETPATSPDLRKRARLRRWGFRALIVVGLYLAFAYLVLPYAWQHYEHQPNLAAAPKIAVTHNDIPGDALNLGLVGTREEVLQGMAAAGWHPADAVTARSSL